MLAGLWLQRPGRLMPQRYEYAPGIDVVNGLSLNRLKHE